MYVMVVTATSLYYSIGNLFSAYENKNVAVYIMSVM